MQNNEPLSPEHELVMQSAFEVAHLGEEAIEEQRTVVGELLGEMAVASEVDDIDRAVGLMQKFDEYIAVARGDNLKDKHTESKKDFKKVELDLSKIGWVAETEKREVKASRIGADSMASDGKKLYLADLTNLSNATQTAMGALADQRTASGEVVQENLLNSLSDTVIPSLYEGIIHGRGARPVNNIDGKNSSRQRKIDTSYPTYKEGIHGTDYRAFVSIIERTDDHVVFGLMAMYDHEYNDRIYNVMKA